MQLDSENPWPGLEPFEEDAHGFFFGRDREANALRSHVLDAPVTVLCNILLSLQPGLLIYLYLNFPKKIVDIG